MGVSTLLQYSTTTRKFIVTAVVSPSGTQSLLVRVELQPQAQVVGDCRRMSTELQVKVAVPVA